MAAGGTKRQSTVVVSDHEYRYNVTSARSVLFWIMAASGEKKVPRLHVVVFVRWRHHVWCLCSWERATSQGACEPCAQGQRPGVGKVVHVNGGVGRRRGVGAAGAQGPRFSGADATRRGLAAACGAGCGCRRQEVLSPCRGEDVRWWVGGGGGTCACTGRGKGVRGGGGRVATGGTKCTNKHIRSSASQAHTDVRCEADSSCRRVDSDSGQLVISYDTFKTPHMSVETPDGPLSCHHSNAS